MKYIITESQLDRAIFIYLNNQDFIQIKGGNRIYFVNSEGDEYAQIKYDKDNSWCYIYHKLIYEISSFFSLELTDSKEVIGRWVEDTLQMRVTYTGEVHLSGGWIVEDTLHMRVTKTLHYPGFSFYTLRIPSN
jgi:hypothetical protein